MSKFAFLLQLLDAYDDMPHHKDSILAHRLNQVQAWQKKRVRLTHATLFAEAKYRPISEYFLTRLYGAADLNELAKQLRRIANHAHIVERVIPLNAMKTGEIAVQIAYTAIKLDEHIAAYLLKKYPQDLPLNEEIMRQAYLDCNQYHARLEQMSQLDHLAEKLDLYMRSRLIKTAFKLSKGMAYRHKVDPIYEFIGEGFKAMEPLQSATSFVQKFSGKERQIIHAVHQQHPRPFTL